MGRNFLRDRNTVIAEFMQYCKGTTELHVLKFSGNASVFEMLLPFEVQSLA